MTRAVADVSERESRLQSSRTIVHRICPRCAANTTRLIDPECAFCLGEGAIRLGAAALYVYEPVVVAEAIEIGLDKALADERDTPGSIATTLDMLAAAGIIHRPTEQEEMTMNEIIAEAPAWVHEWHQDNPTASVAGDIPEDTPETIELEAGTAIIRTYWQNGELGHHLELPDTDVQLMTSADLLALAASLQDIANEMPIAA